MPNKSLIIFSLSLSISLFFVQTVLAGAAALSWNASTEPDLAGYKIYYGLSLRNNNCPTGGYPERIDVGKTAAPEKPTHTFENLEEGKTYYFSVTSYDTSDNESCFSEELSKKIPKLKISRYEDVNKLFWQIFSSLKLFFLKLF